MKIVSTESLKDYRRSLSEIDPALFDTVRDIITDVRDHGDEALIKYSQKFDHVPEGFSIKVTDEEIKKAREIVNDKYAEIFATFMRAADNIKFYHEKQKLDSWSYEREGNLYGQKISPIEKAGLYVPGGKAFYPSSVMMNIIPAKVAGVEELYITTPPSSDGSVHPLLITLAVELGVTAIFKVGGAQAIAALAYGTATIPAVYKITGPGNKYVAAAKRLVSGVVGIDSIAGPSEVVVLTDGGINPAWIAMDLCAQAEHDEDTTVILVSTDRDFIDDVNTELDKIIPTLKRNDIINASLTKNSMAVYAKDLDEAFDITNRMAPEHLEVMMKLSDDEILKRIKNAGAIFLGPFTPVPVGDYYAGPNHVLPTNGTSVFSSPLGVYDFIKRTGYIRMSEKYIQEKGAEISSMAYFEELEAHGKAVDMRRETPLFTKTPSFKHPDDFENP